MIRHILGFVGLVVSSSFVLASYEDFARQKQVEALGVFQSSKQQDVPGFITDSPPEVEFNDYGALESATMQAFNKSEVAQFLKESAEKRPYFALDMQKDPIAINSQNVLENPEGFIMRADYDNRAEPD